MVVEANPIATNLERLRARIANAANRAGCHSEEISLIAVSKTFPPEAIRAAYTVGLRDFGENRVQEWEGKRDRLIDLQATWHFIGHLQSNKARRAAYLFDRVDSLDDLSTARKLNDAAAAEGKRLPVLIEVHLGEEASKSGVKEAGLPQLAEEIAALPHLELRGLITVPPYSNDVKLVRPYFRKLRELRDALTGRMGRPLPVLSMGMSHDFEIAIEEGATEIRIGTALFGERQK